MKAERSIIKRASVLIPSDTLFPICASRVAFRIKGRGKKRLGEVVGGGLVVTVKDSQGKATTGFLSHYDLQELRQEKLADATVSSSSESHPEESLHCRCIISLNITLKQGTDPCPYCQGEKSFFLCVRPYPSFKSCAFRIFLFSGVKNGQELKWDIILTAMRILLQMVHPSRIYTGKVKTSLTVVLSNSVDNKREWDDR